MLSAFSCQGHWPTSPLSRRISESASASCSSPSPIDFVNHKCLHSTLGTFPLLLLSFPSFPRPTSHTLEPSLTFPLLLPKLPIFPEANHSHTLEPSLQKLLYVCKIKFIYPIVSRNEFLSQFSEQLVQITPIVQSHQHHHILASLYSTLPSFPLTAELTVVYHFRTNLLPPVLNFTLFHYPPSNSTLEKAQLLLILLGPTFLKPSFPDKVWKRKNKSTIDIRFLSLLDAVSAPQPMHL